MRAHLPDGCVNCCVTSPPYYGLRDYEAEGQIGMEESPESFVENLVRVFREVRRVLTDDGLLWLNLGDTYAGSGKGAGSNPTSTKERFIPLTRTGGRRRVPSDLKPKDLMGIPWAVAFALRDDGWYLRSEIIWNKPNAKPENVRDRCTRSHEHLFMLSKSERYFFDFDANSEQAVYAGRKRGGSKRRYNGDTGMDSKVYDRRNRRTVWDIQTRPYSVAHFATYPPELVVPCVAVGCPEGGTVLDPFGGSGTTAAVALEMGRKAILCEINPDYAKIALQRISDTIQSLTQAG
jgi:site-specific DNA-methyltransferase (adenine-specific)